MLVVCTSDGNVELIDVTDVPKVVAVLPAAAGATCFFWSPKGKQLLVGRKDGTLAQYDHVLAEKKVWACPSILAGPHRVVDVVWQSTYIFLAAYLPTQAQPSDQPVVIMSISNKENRTSHINFEDVCFGNGEERMAQYFFHFIQKWDVILMASSNATETTIVGRNLDDKVSWEHWNLEDCSRAELPLTLQQSDSFPMGLAVDYSAHKSITINESKTLGPCPIMFLLSTDGMLVSYHLSYTHRDAAAATTPALTLTSAGTRRGIPELVAAHTNAPRGPAQHQHPVSTAAASQPAPATHSLPPAAARGTSSVFSTTTFPFTQPSSVTQTTSQLPFSSFTSPASTAAVFPFVGLGSKQGTPTSGASNQKQPSSIQAPPTSAFSQSGPSPFSFGSQSSMTSNYSFGSTPTTTSGSANVGVPFSLASTAPGPAKPFSQGQPSGTFGAGLPTQGQTLGVVSTPSIFGQSQTSSVAARDGDSQVTSTTGIFGQSQVARDEGLKPSPYTTPPGPQPPGPPQLRPQAAPAFTSKPASLSQGQPGQTPGNGLVLSQSVRRSSPAQTVQPDGIKSSEAFVDSTRFIEATVDSAFTQNILEEIADFERELAELRTHSRRAVKTVGTREEMQSLRQDKEKMVNFAAEINKATKEQLTEVQDQKAMCFNLLAMSEECQTRHKRDLDPHYHSLLLNRVLDPASTERLKSLHQMSQTIEQSVLEVDKTLDGQWQDHLSRKKKEERFYTPAGETIYKSIRNNHIVISSQRQQLEKLEEQLKSLRLYNRLSGRLYSAVQSLNGDETSPLKVEQKPDVTLDSAVVNGMTPEKVGKLREFLSQRKVPRIKSTAPANLSMSRIVHLTPSKSLASANTPTHVGLQQQTPQRQQQQRKHQLPHTAQSLASPSSFQAGPTSGQPHPGIQKQPERQQPGPNHTKLFPSLDEAQRPSPTSFSAMAYLRQQAESGAPSRQPNPPAVVSLPAKTGGGVFPAGTLTRPPLTPTSPGARFGSVPGQPGHTVAPTVIHTSASLHPNTTHSTALHASTTTTTLHASTTTPHSTNLSSSNNLHLYENITPTETEEDDDDYDEEDNGYEDEEEEEEEEEDEEEVGFEGMPLGNQPKSNLAQMLGQQTTKNLQGAPGAGVLNSAGSAGIFKLPQTTSEGDSAAFTPLKTTSQASSAPENIKPIVVAPSTGLASRNLFGVPSTTAPVFGGPALFGDKPGPRLSPNGLGSIFGSQATPSKAVGFSDLTESLASAAGKDGIRQAGPTSSAVPATTEVTSHSPASPSAAAVSSAANAFSFVHVSAGSEAAPQGGHKPTPSSIFGGHASPASVFGGKSPTDGSMFSFGTTPSASSGTGFTFGTSSGTAASTVPVFGTAGASSPVAAAGTTPEPSGRSEKELGSNVAESSSGVGTTSDVQAGKTSLWGVKQEDRQDTSATSSVASEATPTPLAFGTTSPASSLDASKPATSPFLGGGTPQASTTSIFGSSPAKEATPSVFGGATSSTGATPLFGAQTSTTSSAATPSVFGGATSSTGATPLFGAQTSTTSGATTPFGSLSIFGGSTAPLFGSNAAATTTPSVFGSGTSTSAFGGSSAASSIFGGGTTTSASAFSSSGTPLFGGTGTTKSTSLFSSSTGSSAPAFGFGSGGSAASPPAFGAPSTPASSGTGVFGAPSTPASSGTGVFGAPNSGNLFGSSGTPVVSSASTGLFGAGSSSMSAFSSSAPSQTGSPFGQPPASAGFSSAQPSSTGGGSSLFGQSSAFGQQPASSTAGSLFGFGGLGGKPSEEKAKLNVFGTPQVFGSSTNQNTNLFGSTGTTSSFGGTEAPSYFSSTNPGRFAAEAAGVSTSGFGVSSTQQTSGGFGAAPTFGSSPSFGGASTFGNKVGGFGSSPSFGGSPSFVAPATFSSPGGSTSTFGGNAGGGFSGFASTAAPSFGQLAQASPPATGFGTGGGFGSAAQPQPAVFGGGFGATQSSFSGGSLFGQASSSLGFGGAQPQGFASNPPSFGANPAFSSYRG